MKLQTFATLMAIGFIVILHQVNASLLSKSVNLKKKYYWPQTY